ncbi:competence type IV pilus minor pilin ComGF [Shouchella shacheensis]|uniref:competence type IV pilus minor pilin ComGF n=1 Tax=Shouchella shacheensis TaxID=1649580 RepID=UPI0007405367|nr:competence type IV pilus minor pilin ComGF [Shouchella shacheensis]
MRFAFMRAADERGFTLLEQLVALAIFFLIVAVVPQLLKAVPHSLQAGQVHQQDVQMFFNHIAKEAKEAELVVWRGEGLQVHETSDSVISYEIRRAGTIQRFRNRAGHVPVLEGVERFECATETEYVRCTVQMEKGPEYTRTFLPARKAVQHVRGQ